MLYTTEYIHNLATREPFQFEVPEETVRRLKTQKRLIREGQAPALGTIEELTLIYEFSFFPTYHELMKIWLENGYKEELITAILIDFGLTDSFIAKLLEDQDYVDQVRPWFEGITCDGERAARVLAIIYQKTQQFFSP